MDFQHPYLSTQLIAYIGNKRALLPFLHDVLRGLREAQEPGPGSRTGPTFLDPFAGSGAVSRLARMMGFAVSANDWEPYSRVINSCHLASADHARRLFGRAGGLEAAIAELNALAAPSPEKRYIARHYAPRSTEAADWRTERLFYTTENALRIDAMRWRIEEMYTGEPAAGEARLEKDLLLGPLLYEAATHTNTSGVFKACHRGFGGHGRDALTRIMGPVLLSLPVVVDAPWPASVSCEDAARFLARRTADVCYLDPPYAVHQYGSNYFMLNTIALWDRPDVSAERQSDGRLVHKAGIRADWTATRSAFCYKSTAAAAMREVVRAADCRYLVVSYSNEGLIGLEELCDILSETGSLTLRSTGYQKYPGGKQSLFRTTRNIELALVVDRSAARAGASARARASARPPAAGVKSLIRQVEMTRLMAMSYVPSRIRSAFGADERGISMRLASGGSVFLPMVHCWRFPEDVPAPTFETPEDAERFAAQLFSCRAADVREEIDVVLEIAATTEAPREKEKLLREALRLLNKLAHRKYAAEFRDSFAKVDSALSGLPCNDGRQPERLRERLSRVASTAQRRAQGRESPGP